MSPSGWKSSVCYRAPRRVLAIENTHGFYFAALELVVDPWSERVLRPALQLSCFELGIKQRWQWVLRHDLRHSCARKHLLVCFEREKNLAASKWGYSAHRIGRLCATIKGRQWNEYKVTKLGTGNMEIALTCSNHLCIGTDQDIKGTSYGCLLAVSQC